MNTQILAVMKSIDTKFCMQVTVYNAQIKIALNIGYHAHRPHKSIICLVF